MGALGEAKWSTLRGMEDGLLSKGWEERPVVRLRTVPEVDDISAGQGDANKKL